MTPAPPPVPLSRAHELNSFLDGVGRSVGEFLSHPHIVNISSAHVHVAPHLALAAVPIALGTAALPVGAWLAGHHEDLGLRLGGFDPRVRKEMWRWNRMTDKVFPAKPGFMAEAPIIQKAIGGRRTKSGVTLLIHFANRGNPEGLANEKVLAGVASHLGCPVEIERIYLKPHRALARLQRRDTLAKSTPWPWLNQPITDFFGPIPVAVDLNGNTIYVDLREKNALLGGEPGGGKTATLHEYIAAAALDVRVRIHIFAGKQGTDFRVWEPICDTFVTDDKDDAGKLIPALEKIEARMDRTYKSFPPGVHAINWNTAKRVDLVVIDEPGAFPPVLWKKELAFNARGRAAGVMSVLATQRPSSKIMDTDLRALYQIRHGHRIEDAGMLMTLGDNYRGFTAKDFGPDRAGECWLVPNDRTAVHCRSCFLTDSDLANLAERARVLRAIDAAPTGSVPNDTAHNDSQFAVDTPPTPVAPKLELVSSTAKTTETPGVKLTGTEAADKLRDLLEAIAELGPEVTGPALRTALQVGSDVISVRGRKLLDAGYVQNARKRPQDAPSGGSRDPLVWWVTDPGREALAASGVSRNDQVAPKREAGAQ